MRTTRDAQRDTTGDPDVPRRSIRQMQADALVRLAEHALGCDHTDLPLQGATVIVRINHEDLVNGTGFATIDGITAPVSVATARRMAAGGQIISCVLGGQSQILDWGRTKRLYTTTQKLALVERDGGCAGCGAPPGHTKVHHIRWWARDAGPTDLNNGVLLCDSCHHRIHDNDWDIRIDGTGIAAKVWFIPPPHIDPARTPRLGGRARYDYAA
jgi:5-methylcytosine-specific restriction protein A